MIRFDDNTLSLPRLWAAVGLLVLIDLIWLSPLLVGNPIGSWFIQLLPSPVLGRLLIFAPVIVAAMWLVVVVLGAVIHGRRGFWLLFSAFVLFPATYLDAFIITSAAVSSGF